MPTPTSFIATSSPAANPRNTMPMATAAVVTTGPDAVMPRSTARSFATRGSSPGVRARHSSAVRDSRKTS